MKNLSKVKGTGKSHTQTVGLPGFMFLTIRNMTKATLISLGNAPPTKRLRPQGQQPRQREPKPQGQLGSCLPMVCLYEPIDPSFPFS